MEDLDTTVDTLDESSQLNDASVEATVKSVSAEDSLTLAEINSLLGKSFKDKATALKSVKDTFNYVGKKREDILKEVRPADTEALTKEMKELKDNLFYTKNPEFESYRDVIAKFGSNPAEVVNSKEFKGIYDKVKGYDESQKLKTVLESNPRLASSKDSLTKARESYSKNGVINDEVELNVLNAVKDAYGF